MSITPRPATITSAREASLFPDNVPMSVYDNLIESVHANLPALYRYYDLRRREDEAEGHPPLRHLRARSSPTVEKKHTWDQAVKVVIECPRAAGR